MTIARKDIVVEGVEGLYHCISRCVRRAFLCGDDPYSGRSFEHRKAWIRNRLIKLSKSFGIEVCAYAVMSNHIHLVLRTRPDWVERWSDLETARRWLMIFPSPKARQEGRKQPESLEARVLAGDEKRISELRSRLGNVSWFMRCLNENIARRANLEDDCQGRFWEGRFKCQALLDEPAVLACLAYVDLNPIRAGLADTPEKSEFTSGYDRIHSQTAAKRPASGPGAWLCPIGDEGGPERRGILELSLLEYLEILDWTGRSLRSGGGIPPHLDPILTRIGIDPIQWPRTAIGYGRLFQRVAGRVESIRKKAARLGRRWLCGLKAGETAFTTAC